MSSKFRSPGHVVDYTPATAKTDGQEVQEGNLFGVCATAIAAGELGALAVSGVFELTALSTSTASFGADAYWDDTAKNVTHVSTSNLKIGQFVRAKTNGQTTAWVLLAPSA